MQVWSQLKKKPISIYRGAHAKCQSTHSGTATAAEGSWAVAGSDASSWVQSVAVCRGADLAASGAGDGAIKLWAIEQSKHGGAGSLRQLGALPAPGFVNGLAIAKSARFVLAAIGQEPRLGRWGHSSGARNGLLMHKVNLAAEDE
eukprot:jgi/Chrzof1/14876/Cz09g19070.t1